MTDQRANEIVAGVKARNKQFAPRMTVGISTDMYMVRFKSINGNPNRITTWFANEGGKVDVIGTDVEAGEMYLYFREK